jgi:transcriptional regulator with GAF, ATPase, and Fis domain
LGVITPEICEFISAMSRNGEQRILVLVNQEADLGKEEAWQVLESGASDVLVWRELAEPGVVIAARLNRWRELDELAGSSLVRKNLVGESQAWKSVIGRIVEVARFTDSPVLLMGETGTGKELAARLIHTLDCERNKGELVIFDYSTIVPELSGSELFGHERGAFTGAVAARDGAFALADGGTLFLDEVGELPMELQMHLLRALQEQTYKRVGSNNWRHADFRLICATNRDLKLEESQGLFRSDLYYRIAACPIILPPLRERVQDILPLVQHFMEQAIPGQRAPELDERVREFFLTRSYPGNVRDLKNLVYRIMTSFVGKGPISVGMIPPDERPSGTQARNWSDLLEPAIRSAIYSGTGLKEIRRTIEELAIKVTLEDASGNLQLAAEKLGVTDRALQKRRATGNRQIEYLKNGGNSKAGSSYSYSSPVDSLVGIGQQQTSRKVQTSADGD